jgi:hypothetical protein
MSFTFNKDAVWFIKQQRTNLRKLSDNHLKESYYKDCVKEVNEIVKVIPSNPTILDI